MPPQRGPAEVDKPKNGMLKCRTILRPWNADALVLSPRGIWDDSRQGGYTMDMFGKVGLVEVPILIAPDQKAWMDRMIKEGKIAIPPGGTLEKGSLYSMFVRMLLHNAMEEQKRQEVLDAEDEDDDE